MQNEVLTNLNKKTEWERLRACLVPTFIIGLIAHAYGFLHNIFAHDSLNAFYADADEEKWKVALGRFMVPVVRKLLTGSVALPWVIGLLSLTFISLSLYFIVKIFNVDCNKKLPMFLLAGIMVTNTTVTAGVATYNYELHFDMLALLLAVVSAYIWSKYDKIGWYALSTVLIVLSLALYQSYFEVLLLLMILFSIFKLLGGENSKSVLVKALKGLATAVVGFVVYYLLYKVITMLTGIEPEGRTNELSLSLKSVYMIFKRIGKFYLEPASVYSSIAFAVIDVLILLITVALVLFGMSKLGKGKAKEKVLTIVLGVATVVSINVIAVSGAKIHDLMTYAFWLVFTFPVILIFTGKVKEIKAVKVVCVVLVGLFIWNNILVSNTAYIKRDNEQSATLSVLTRVIDDLEDRDDYKVGETELAFIGHIDVLDIDEEKEFNSITEIEGLRYGVIKGGIEKEWYFNCYEAYFKYFLDYPINYTDGIFTERECVKEMPCFPNDGYIENIDGVLVVKLGEVK